MEIHSIDGLISVSEGYIPYLGYTVATLEFPYIPNYSEEVVMLVVSYPTDYATRVPLQIGTRVIAAITQILTQEDMRYLDETWKQTFVGTLMSCVVQQKKDGGDSFNLDKVMSVNIKADLLPHNSKVKILLRNVSTRAVKVPAKTTIGEVSPCNVILVKTPGNQRRNPLQLENKRNGLRIWNTYLRNWDCMNIGNG